MCVWKKLFLSTYFTIQLIFAAIHGPTALFSIIYRSHCTISTNVYLCPKMDMYRQLFFFLVLMFIDLLFIYNIKIKVNEYVKIKLFKMNF